MNYIHTNLKNLILIIVTILAQFTSAFSQNWDAYFKKPNYENQLKGNWTISEWTMQDKKYSISDYDKFIFDDKNKVTAIIGADTLKGTYVYNSKKKPHWIDFNLKKSTGQSVQSQGIIEWIDYETARIDIVAKGEARPKTFEDDPDLDRSGIMRRFEINVSYLKENLINGTWDISFLYNADIDLPSDKKYHAITFFDDNRYRLKDKNFMPGTSGEGSYELNTIDVPNWIDFYPDEGKTRMGLIQEHLHGYKLELYMDSELNNFIKRSKSKSGHPLQFLDVESGVSTVINYNSNFLYLQRSTEVQKNSKVTESSNKNGTVDEVPAAVSSESVDIVIDIEGNTYKTILFGNGQRWMAENLKYLPSVAPFNTGSQTDAHYYVYDYNGTNVADAKATANYQTYGVLYNWPAALSACPAGWHLPSDAEWTQLTTYLGGESVAGGKLKETGTTHWNSPNTCATNEVGFSALPGGDRFSNSTFYYIGSYGYWWSATEYDATIAWYRGLGYDNCDLGRYNDVNKDVGFSVRCVKD